MKRLSWFKTPGFQTARDILVITAIVAFIGFAAFAFKNLMVSGEYRTEYEGTVVAKSIRVHESQEGSWEEKCLMIMDRTQTQFQVVVPSETYERANIGMWIKRDKKGLELSAAKDSGAG